MGRVSWVDGDGPLVPFAGGYRQELLSLGHPPSSVKPHMVLLGQLNRWLSAEASASAASRRWWRRRFWRLDELRATGEFPRWRAWPRSSST